jgi:hypothetical protein
MSAAWVAGSVRARAMTRRRLGRAEVVRLAASQSIEEAVTALAQTTYSHDVHPGQSLAEAQRAVVSTVAWNVRVLAGWTPREGVAVLRALMGVLEAANVQDHLLGLTGAAPPPPFRLGGLATAWPRLQRTASVTELRRELATSVWGDPGGETSHEVALALRTSLADRVMAAVPAAGAWATGATALLVARELLVERRDLPAVAKLNAARLLGLDAVASGSLSDLVDALPASARWALADVRNPEELWRAEARWWARVDRDGSTLARRPESGPGVVVGVVAMMAVDAWRVRAALALAAHGGGTSEVLDAVA